MVSARDTFSQRLLSVSSHWADRNKPITGVSSLTAFRFYFVKTSLFLSPSCIYLVLFLRDRKLAGCRFCYPTNASKQRLCVYYTFSPRSGSILKTAGRGTSLKKKARRY
ncbi:hypothetical protein RvY_17608 [Ramazzottius varieornatus]|uniref:Uncharacterized protein n=1 Tax=Ramazzottius varieornatus TaxID=947166 RepID=A0A1D1W4V3_RAMVA|nr:hypothetical protein RvY_17608 [Ramazzottius varieornatus]